MNAVIAADEEAPEDAVDGDSNQTAEEEGDKGEEEEAQQESEGLDANALSKEAAANADRKPSAQQEQPTHRSAWDSVMSVLIGPSKHPQKPSRPRGWKPSIQEQEADVQKPARGIEPCKEDVQASLHANRARLRAAGIARARASVDIYFDTVDAVGNNSSFAANRDRLAAQWGNTKSRPSPMPTHACSAALEDTVQSHK